MERIIRDVLDKQLVDRHERPMGKVDGVVIEWREGEPPRLAYIEVGTITLARRLHPRLEQWTRALGRRWGIERSQSYRIPWEKVRHIGIDVEVDLEVEETPLLQVEKWLSQNLIGRIPGASHGKSGS